jgi:predicted RNase H-like nuclease (RuvC/YqgF family)
MVLREEQEKETYNQRVDFAKLRSELQTADSTESSLTRSSHERLTNELAKLNSRLRDEVQRTQASVRLDLNLEKGRIREEANVQELKLKETETRIEQETAQLRERLETVKFQTLQWLVYVHEYQTMDTWKVANFTTGACALVLRLSCSVFGESSCEAYRAAKLFQKASA